MAFWTNGPPPSSLVLLSDLPDLPAGSKVRVSGCVTRYDFSNGRLRISFQQPNHDLKQQAEVDITIVLETITRELLTVGSWISLIGYVLNDTKHSDYVEASDAPGKKRTRQPAKLQAVALWDAGQLRNAAPGGDYEASVHSRRTAMHLMAAARSQNRA